MISAKALNKIKPKRFLESVAMLHFSNQKIWDFIFL
jgi:hypothetical protein